MDGDLVAELTLVLRNEMNAGLDAIKAELQGVDTEVAELRESFGGLAASIDDLPTGDGMTEGLAAIASQAKLASDAVAGLGTTINDEYAKFREMTSAGGSAFVPPGVSGNYEADANAPSFIPPGVVLPGDETPPPPDQPADDGHGGGSGGQESGHDFGVMDMLAFLDGQQAVESNAKFASTLAQITNTEKLHGDDAAAEQERVADNVVMWAQQYHASSEDLLNAYKFLITTGLKPQEVDALMPGLAEASTAHAISVTDMQGAVFALADSFKIQPDQMGALLGQLGAATKMGHFSAESFGQFLPVIGGALATAGDTGPDVADDTYAAMETIIKNVSIPSEAATDYTDMIHYIGTQHAERSFLQMSRMMLPQMRAIFSKYDISPADLYGMEDNAVSEGKDPIQTVLDFVHKATKDMSPTDRNAVISDYFTNQQGGDAVRSLMLHWGDANTPETYQGDIAQLKNIGQGTLDDDFKAAVQNASGDMNLFAENLSELNRDFGKLLNYIVIQPANAIMSPGYLVPPTGNSNLDEPLPSGSRFHAPREPVQINLNIKPDGSVVPAPSQPTPPAGISVRVNQGTVLGSP